MHYAFRRLQITVAALIIETFCWRFMEATVIGSTTVATTISTLKQSLTQ